MATDISTVNRNLIGISFLEDKYSKERIKKQWDARFSPMNSFWLEASAEDTVESAYDKCVNLFQGQNITSLTGQPVVMAFFVDCTQELSENMLRILKSLARALEGMLQCVVHAEIQFCYVGRLSLGSRERQRMSLRTAVTNNSKKTGGGYHRLCLVATPSLGASSSNEWKSAIVYLDLLRRCPNLADLMPIPAHGNPNENVGYLMYEEHDEQEYDRLTTEKKYLETLQGNSGADELHEILTRRRDELKNQVEEQFTINASLQPQHTDMFVPEGGGFLGMGRPRDKAAKGKLDTYNQAVSATRSAVTETGERMTEEILELFRAEADRAPEILRKAWEDANVGMETLRNRKAMESAVKVPGTNGGLDVALEMKYTPNGCAGEIGEYLRSVRETAVSRGIDLLNQQMKTALNGITPEELDQREADLLAKLNAVKLGLNKIPSISNLCSAISGHGDPKECCFSIMGSLSAASRKMLLARGHAMEDAMEAAITGNKCERYAIYHPHGGIVRPDTAPLKALKVIYVYCSDEALQQLLHEVIV